MTVDAKHVGLIRACLASQAACTDVTVTPVISGWARKPYGSSEAITPFLDIGSKVQIRFTADERLVEPLLRAGFAVLGMDLIPISETRLAA